MKVYVFACLFCWLGMPYSGALGQVINPIDITPAGIDNPWDFQFVDSLSGYLYADGTIWNTIDGGNSWQSIPCPIDTGALYVRGMSDVYIGGKNRVAHTSDFGQSWTVSGALDTADIAEVTWLQFLSDSTGFATMRESFSGTARLYKTTDAGLNWTRMNGLFAGSYKVGIMRYAEEYLYFLDGNIGFGVAPWMGTNAYLQGTTDGGLTWDTVAVGPMGDLSFSNPMLGHWGMDFVTTDAGASWQSTGNTLPHYSVGWLDGQNALLQSQCQNVTTSTWVGAWSKTTNGALSTIPLSSPVYPLCYGKIEVLGPGIAYAGGVDPGTTFGYLGKITDALVGLDGEPKPRFDFKAFPNPVAGTLRLSFESPGEKRVEVLDALGRRQLEKTLFETEEQMDLSMLSKGLYFLRVHAETGVSSQSIRVLR